MTCNTDGTDEQILSTIDTNSQFISLDWSPDGKKLLYGFRQHMSEGYSHYLAEIPAAGGEEYRITRPRRERIFAAQWLPDKSGVIMTVVDPQTNLPQLYSVSYPGGEEQRLTNDLHDYKDLSITDDGRTIVTQLHSGTANLWLMPAGDQKHAVALGSSTKGWYQGLCWTPAGELVYDSEEDGVRQISKMSADGSRHQQLTTGPGHKADPSVTPDGRHIFFFSTRSGSGQIWRMTANGDDPVQLTHSDVGVSNPQSSPDGQWVYYTADVLGEWQVWKVPMNGGEEQVVETAPVRTWAISPDGKMLAYSFFDEQNKKMRVAVRWLNSPEPFRYFDISSTIKLEWTRDGRALTYIEFESGNKNVWLQPLEGGAARPLTALGADQWIVSYALSPDGKMLAYTRINTLFDAALIRLK
jgi:Tol biopolymer transport system component